MHPFPVHGYLQGLALHVVAIAIHSPGVRCRPLGLTVVRHVAGPQAPYIYASTGGHNHVWQCRRLAVWIHGTMDEPGKLCLLFSTGLHNTVPSGRVGGGILSEVLFIRVCFLQCV